MEWQPIETAPKDYTTILVCSGTLEYGTFVTWWKGGRDHGWWANDKYGDIKYWLPLPKLPEED